MLKEEEPFCCISCGKAFGVKSTIERIVEKLEGKHWMYTGANAGRLDLDAQVRHVLQGVGVSGTCRDYLFQTCGHLREVGIADHALEELERRVRESAT